MTKKEFTLFAKKRGFSTRYSGILKKHFLTPNGLTMDIHKLINAK